MVQGQTKGNPCLHTQGTTMQAAQRRVLAAISEALARDGSLQGALGACLEGCQGVAGTVGLALYLVQRGSGELRLEHQVGFTLPQLESADADGRLRGLARGSERAIAVPSPDVDEVAGRRLLQALAVDVSVYVPLVWAGRIHGVLLVGAQGEALVGAEGLGFAELVATHLAQALAMGHKLRRLAATEACYRAVVDQTNDAVFLVDDLGFIRESNRRFQELTGRPAEAVLGQHIRDFAAPGHAEANLMSFRRTLHQPGHGGGDARLAAADGKMLVMRFSGSVIELAGERVVVAVGRDVTEERQTQAQLLLSDRMASVGMLAAGVAHEINNPLSAVLANLEMASRDAAELSRRPAAVTELAEEVLDAREGADRVREIVRDLKLFARNEADVHGAVDVHRVLESAARMAWNELRHRAHVVKAFAEVPAVLGNESRLGQVFLNLIVNAAQAIPEGRADDNQVTLTTRVEGGQVVVEVSDTGQGMTPEVRARLFSPFFTTKPVGIGTGLGLSICQRIVLGLGGTIEAESEPGRGSTFRVRLLPADATVPLPSESTLPANLVANRGRVLVVDDDALVVKLIHRILVAEHEVTAVTSAQAALDLVDAGERFDVILCDVMMPQLNGMDLHQRLGALAPAQAARMVFVTGGAFTPRAREFLAEVPNPCIEKPFDPLGLRSLVSRRVAAGRTA